MEEIAITVLKSLKDPMLLIVFAVICGLYYLLLQKEKTHKEICTDIKKVNETIAEGNVINAKLLTLVEVLVHGRN